MSQVVLTFFFPFWCSNQLAHASTIELTINHLPPAQVLDNSTIQHYFIDIRSHAWVPSRLNSWTIFPEVILDFDKLIYELTSSNEL